MVTRYFCYLILIQYFDCLWLVILYLAGWEDNFNGINVAACFHSCATETSCRRFCLNKIAVSVTLERLLLWYFTTINMDRVLLHIECLIVKHVFLTIHSRSCSLKVRDTDCLFSSHHQLVTVIAIAIKLLKSEWLNF